MLGGLIGAGLGLVGNILGMNKAEDEADEARQFALGQSARNEALQREFFERNLAAQREFAQHGVRWRVDDARAAGLHPLFALSGGGASYSPSAYVPGDVSSPRAGSGEFLSRMGQDVGRAIAATQTREERFDDTLRTLQIQKTQAEIELLKSQAAKNTGQLGPPFPTVFSSSGDAAAFGAFEGKPAEVTAWSPHSAAVVAGPAQPYTQFTYTGSGLLGMPNKNVGGMDDIDMSNPYGMEHFVRNRITPMMGATSIKPSLAEIHRHWPQATDSYFHKPSMEWRPLFGRVRDPYFWENIPSKSETARRLAEGRKPTDWSQYYPDIRLERRQQSYDKYRQHYTYHSEPWYERFIKIRRM